MQGVGGLEDMRVEEEKAFVSEAPENNKALVRRFLEALAERDLDALEEMMSPDFVDHSLLPGQKPGREGYIQGVAEDHAAFSNVRYRIEDMVAQGDKVITCQTDRFTPNIRISANFREGREGEVCRTLISGASRY